MQLLHHASFSFVFTIKQDLVIGLTQMINFQQKTEVQELAHIIVSNYITLFSSHCKSVRHVKDGMTCLTQFDHNTRKVYINYSELWRLEALYEGTYDICHTPSSADQKGPEMFVPNFSALTVSQDEHQSLYSIFVSIIHKNVQADETGQ
jgi:hypothetical protein